MQKKKTSRVVKVIGILALVLVEFVALYSGYLTGGSYADAAYKKKNSIAEIIKAFPEDNEKPEKEADLAEEILSGMSLSEKVYQMMFVTPEAITGIGTAVQAGETTKKAIQKHPVGGIIYFSKNFESREQTKTMIANTQSYSEIPLFISVDEEGGVVARLGSNKNMGTTKQPPMRTIGNTGNPEKAYEVGANLAKDLKPLGFNVDFAPVADVIVNEKNTEIGNRAFGTDPVLVSEMVKNAVKGLENNDVSATLKHFPGHGSTYVDSHTGYSASSRTLEELRSCEFLPFKAAIDADFIMVSHMTLVNATEEKVPSSLSKEVITDMLKDELGYEGIIITDAFNMGAITKQHTQGEAAVKAVNAGVDMILMPTDLVTTHSALVKAVESGELTEERIDESVRKILRLKIKKGLLPPQ